MKNILLLLFYFVSVMSMISKKDIDVYIIGTDYCPYCAYFNNIDKCYLKIGKHKGKAYCKCFKQEE